MTTPESKQEDPRLVAAKQTAKNLGIPFKENIGLDTLEARISNFKAANAENKESSENGSTTIEPTGQYPNEKETAPPETEPDGASVVQETAPAQPQINDAEYEEFLAFKRLKAQRLAEDLLAPAPAAPVAPVVQKSAAQEKNEHFEKLRLQQTKLVRVVVHCNNDEKSEWQGETIKVANKVVGSITKFVPFDNDAGYHLPQIMVDTLEDKMCQKFRNVRAPTGENTKVPYMTKEFSITILPPLTPKELEELAADQRARGAID